jgi:hypothetical protein
MPATRPRKVNAKTYRNLLGRRHSTGTAYEDAVCHQDWKTASTLLVELQSLDDLLDMVDEHDQSARDALQRSADERVHPPGQPPAGGVPCLRCFREQAVAGLRELTGGLDLS